MCRTTYQLATPSHEAGRHLLQLQHQDLQQIQQHVPHDNRQVQSNKCPTYVTMQLILNKPYSSFVQ